MPYTPPSHRSPASSAPASPDVSRRPSFQSGPRPSLPRSSSYLTKHRRTPSALGQGNGTHNQQPTPPGTSTDLKSLTNTNSSVRQSPPPVTDDRGMPNGAVLSPPDSASSGSDDEGPAEVRGRRIENLRELEELKSAISQISQRREGSPNKDADARVAAPATTVAARDLHVVTSQLPTGEVVEGMHQSFSTGSLTGLVEGATRRSSHTRSITESHVNVIISKSAEASLTASEEESDGEPRVKPQMVRKKSGELVRPALRPASRRRPSSMPGTPTFSKTVHFDSHEHVRHFLQVDRPLAVSAGSSPAENYDSDNEFPFPGEEQHAGTRSPPYEWEIITTHFPADTLIRKALPIRLERVWLSSDQRCLMGSIAVANLAFQKFVACRFTLDYWKTTSEVAAEFAHEILPKDLPEGRDRFNFTIKLSDLANLETKTLYFCLRYNVNGQEYWDNNSGANFQVDFRKKHLPQNGKRHFQGAAARPLNPATGVLPRSTRRPTPSTAPRPKSMPAALDEFGDQTNFNFDQPIHEYLGEIPTTLRLKASKSTSVLPSDNLSGRLSAPSGQAFANRYDFGASLTAAVQAAKDSIGKDRDGLYMKANKRQPASTMLERKQPTLRETVSDPIGLGGTDKAASNPVATTVSPNSTIASSSYEELVNKYCFFGSKPSSPQAKDGTLRNGRYYDGNDDGFATRGSSSTNSSLDSSPLMTHHAGAAMHHSLHPRDPNPYFNSAHALSGGYSSPVAVSSPLRSLGPQAPSSSPRSVSPSKAASGGVPSTLRSSSPAAMAGGLTPFAGTSPSEFPYAQHLQERFPFAGTETHAATASCG